MFFIFCHENIFLLIGWLLHGCFPLLLSCYSQNMGNLESSGSRTPLSEARPSLDIGVAAFAGCTHGHSYIFFWEVKTIYCKLLGIQKCLKHSIFLYFQKFILEFIRLLRAP